jgi:hypothetical protein
MSYVTLPRISQKVLYKFSKCVWKYNIFYSSITMIFKCHAFIDLTAFMFIIQLIPPGSWTESNTCTYNITQLLIHLGSSIFQVINAYSASMQYCHSDGWWQLLSKPVIKHLLFLCTNTMRNVQHLCMETGHHNRFCHRNAPTRCVMYNTCARRLAITTGSVTGMHPLDA